MTEPGTRAATGPASMGERRRCAVLGSPIAHSLSPALHRAAYDVLGLDWTYEAVEVTAEELPAFVADLDRSWRGLSLTMPLKRAVLRLADRADDWARLAGAANTLVLEQGSWAAYNTDVPGAREALRERTSGMFEAAIVLGGGATAASTLLALADLGCRRVVLAVREPRRAEETLAVVRRHDRAPDVSLERLDTLESVREMQADVVVSTIPASAQDDRLRAAVRGVPVVFDVVYDPWPTPLAVDAAASGRTLVSGLDLLAHQAVLQVQLMTGRPVPVELLRQAGQEELTVRAVHSSADNASAID